MPQLVALGQFDIAITGRDCLLEHLQVSVSPVEELVDLSAVSTTCPPLSANLPADNIETPIPGGVSEVEYSRGLEFAGTADYYARSRHIWRYQVMPIAGASEGFVPEDAELLIEGTETGKTLRENRLKPIDLLYRSTTCVIGRKGAALEERRSAVLDEVVGALRTSAEAAKSV
jgi:ATP phosphoribosyltransferase